MKIVFIYPPPWKIPAVGQLPDTSGDGPPDGFLPTDLDGDFFQMPYGLLSLAAMQTQAGHFVKLVNLSAFDWDLVQRVVRNLGADVFGLSCYTANRRGVFLVASLIKQHHPNSHVVIGGPHATALARPILQRIPAIDSVVIGEGEFTFRELMDRLGAGRELNGVLGLAHRVNGGVVVEPPRERIRDLDALVSPHQYYRTHLMMTSRGCPGQCTFCAKSTTWGKLVRFHSVDYVLSSIGCALDRLASPMLQIKDDTFTVDRKRVMALCDGIMQRGLRFRWSCDSRADALDEPVVRRMRLAGCERISLGVESGSPEILRNIKKGVSLDRVFSVTELCKRFGLQVRYFMMLGNRGETAETVRQSLQFVHRAQPHQALFSCLSIYPGTSDFRLLRERGWVDESVYFEGDFQELKTPFDATDDDTELMSRWFEAHRGIHTLYEPSVEDCENVLTELGEFASGVLDLAAAHYRNQHLDEAEHYATRALALEYPSPGLVHNYLACIAYDKGDTDGMMRHLRHAELDPVHPVLAINFQRVKQWESGGRTGLLRLEARHDFELMQRPEQPSLPGPLPSDYAVW